MSVLNNHGTKNFIIQHLSKKTNAYQHLFIYYFFARRRLTYCCCMRAKNIKYGMTYGLICWNFKTIWFNKVTKYAFFNYNSFTILITFYNDSIIMLFCNSAFAYIFISFFIRDITLRNKLVDYYLNFEMCTAEILYVTYRIRYVQYWILSMAKNVLILTWFVCIIFTIKLFIFTQFLVVLVDGMVL